MGVRVIGDKLYSNEGGLMVILLNGTQIEDISGIDPRSLTGVQIIKRGITAENMGTALMLEPKDEKSGTNYKPFDAKERKTIYRYDQSPKDGIIFLTMKGIPNKFIKPDRPPGFLQQSVAGYTYAREFYTPSYEVQKDGPKNDFRSTLFWKPDIITGENGKAEFSFYASDEPGQYRVTLEGIGSDGQLCRKISYFVVK